MLSLRSRDEGRRGMGLGFQSMEENELEEGEAFLRREDDAYVDPEVAFSYIDEKLQDVLGHFQKDFEGGVSAENLGARFGGYGSFLPTHQRSPSILSQPKSPLATPDHTLFKSPYNSSVECERQNPSVSRGTTISRNNNASVIQPGNLNRKENSISSVPAGSCFPLLDSNVRPVNVSNTKSLKVRIKVGPDNTLARNNAAIYSGLGLDTSPSSPEDSAGSSLRLSSTFQDASGESPLSILQDMTCFSVPGGHLLSPLQENLFQLTENESNFRRKYGIIDYGEPDMCASPIKTWSMRAMKGCYDKKIKSDEKNSESIEEECLSCRENTVKILKKEKDIDTLASKSGVLTTVNMSTKTCSRTLDPRSEQQITGDSTKVSKKAVGVSEELNKPSAQDELPLPSQARDDQTIPMENVKIGGVTNLVNGTIHSKRKLNSKTSSLEKGFKEKTLSNHKNISSETRRERKDKNKKSYDISKSNNDKYNGRSDHVAGHSELMRQMPAQKVTSHEKMLQVNNQMHEGNKSQKGNHTNYPPLLESIQTPRNLRASCSVVPNENKKTSRGRVHCSENKSNMLKSHKETNNAHSRESQRDVVGNVKAQKGENTADSLEPFTVTENSVERSGVQQEVNLQAKLMENPPFTSSMFTVPTSDVAVALEAPPSVLINWVCCDLCEKWRLLPFDADPNNLPGQWECSMQLWLPGLNNCDISEEVTTKAFNTQYLVPASEIGANLNGHHNIAASSITSADAQLSDRRLDHDLQSVATIGKKKSGPVGVSNVPENSVSKKNLQASVKNRSSTGGNQSTLVANSSMKAVLGLTSKSVDFNMEKHNHKQKEKHEISEGNSDGGDFAGKSGRHSKSKNKREVTQDGFRTAKKIKKANSDYLVEDRLSDPYETGKAAPYVDDGLAAKLTGKILQHNFDHSSSRDSKSGLRHNMSASNNKPKGPVLLYSDGIYKDNLRAADVETSGILDYASKKRKVKEWQESQVHQETMVSPHHASDSGLIAIEAFNENQLMKQKKAKAFSSEGKESIVSNGDEKADKRAWSTRNLLSVSREKQSDGMAEEGRLGRKKQLEYQETAVSRQALDGNDPLERDTNYAQLPTAATSSSSKVSGSRKSKVNVREIRSSPVESVSSSPVRTSTTEKVAIRRNSAVKECIQKKDARVDISPAGVEEVNVVGDAENILDRDVKYLFDRQKEIVIDGGENLYYPRLSKETRQWKSRKNSSCFKERDRSSNPDANRGKLKDSETVNDRKKLYSMKNWVNFPYEADANCNDCNDNCTRHEDSRDGNFNLQLKDGDYSGKKNSSAKSPHLDRRNNHFNYGLRKNLDAHHKDINSRVTSAGGGCKSNLQENLQQEPSYPSENLASLLDDIDRSDVASGRGIPQTVQSPKGKNEAHNSGSQTIPAPTNESRSDTYPTDATNKPDNQIGIRTNSLRATPNCHDTSPMRRDGPSVANVVLKEARDLKHTANRLKSEGLDHESIGLYFESALKFLYGASLLEPLSAECTKHGEMNPLAQMTSMYSDTAKLCKYCAHEYERCKEMAAAALAYKCVEVAYMKVAYYRTPGASKDRHELSTAFQTVVPGESPSSSSSDIDSLNSQGALDKAASARAAGSPIAGNLVIGARNRPAFSRLLSYTLDLNCAFDATRRSQNAIAVASANLEKDGVDGISSVRKVLDFNFHNVEELLRLVRLAMELISC
ncbi:uncharacterized protein A4U43_UnF6900 [Asparagus officinalis]|uniref:CW-type domain-containing protein n=1 Tax=Asparagus officinalis TaxID=4686 RepID=A0A1R3L6B8_ASPOF|nr:uncharacterized protein LOC109827750 [Asparagus officinalis]ONK55163.1 uncharacterized protein A4U43_UnF6900 [Asparagus officinalis]